MEPLALATELAEAAGKIIRSNFQLQMKKDWKSDNSPVTATDLEINSLVVKRINEHFPGHTVVGEEESATGSDEWAWVCDPVDGTIPFSHGVPTSCFSLALCQDGQPILAVVLDPFMNRLFVAEKGKGASVNGTPIRVRSDSRMERLLVYTGSPNMNSGIMPLRTELLEKENAWLFDSFSCIYAGMLVAAGEFGGILFDGKTPWDVVTLKLLIEEAGGVTSDIFGETGQRYDRKVNGLIGGNRAIHQKLVELSLKHLSPHAR